MQKLTTRHVGELASHMATKKGVRGEVLSPASRRQALFVLGRALEAAIRAGYIRNNPAKGVKRPRLRRKEMKYWTAEQLSSFLRSTRGDRLHPLWRFLSHTGLRRGEALGLRIEDLDVEAGTVIVRRQLTKSGSYEAKEGPLKAGKPRTIDLDPGTVEVLKAQLQQQLADAEGWGKAWTESGYLFTRESGLPWHPDAVYAPFIRAAEAAAVPRIRLHDLRHTWATIALQAGVNMKVVQERLGHASIKTTMDLYSHVMPGMQREASQVVAARVAAAVEGKKKAPVEAK
jgi:integrase